MNRLTGLTTTKKRLVELLIGAQPALAFTVDDCHATYDTLREQGVEFTTEPREQLYGTEAIARDLRQPARGTTAE